MISPLSSFVRHWVPQEHALLTSWRSLVRYVSRSMFHTLDIYISFCYWHRVEIIEYLCRKIPHVTYTMPMHWFYYKYSCNIQIISPCTNPKAIYRLGTIKNAKIEETSWKVAWYTEHFSLWWMFRKSRNLPVTRPYLSIFSTVLFLRF